MTIPLCPKCNTKMVKRTAKKTGINFWGCSQFFKTGCNGYRPFIAEIEKIEKLSVQQKEIEQWVLKSNRSRFLTVSAGAGTGKTSLNKHIIAIVREKFNTQNMIYAVFNAHNREEAKEKGISFAKTWHQLGYAAIMKVSDGDVEVNNSKVVDIIRKNIEPTYHPIAGIISQLVSKYKNLMLPVNVQNTLNLIQKFDIEIPKNSPAKDTELLVELIAEVLTLNNKIVDMIDFDDMIYLPNVLNINMPKYDWVFGDEVQDWNAAQLQLCKKIVHSETQGMFVGDENQSMYAFRGADIDAMDNITAMFDCETLPLSVTFRCPKLHVQSINDRFPEIKFDAYEYAEEGQIKDINSWELIEYAKEKDLVLCRTNSPLFRMMLEFLKEGIQVQYRGIDIYNKVKSFMDANFEQSEDIENIKIKIKNFLEELIAEDDYTNNSKIDLLDTILILLGQSHSVRNMLHQLHTLTKSKYGTVFSSIHKAKGDESDNVFILYPNLMPHSMASKPWEFQQERNIEYVARSRAKKILYEVY